jgi:hypothetical protein
LHDERQRTRQRVPTSRAKPRGIDMTKAKTTKIVKKKTRIVRRKIIMHSNTSF